MAATLRVHRRLPPSETYACSKNEAKEALGALDGAEVGFGARSHFEFDSRCHHRPTLEGSVIASAHVTRELEVSVQFYPIAQGDYSDREHRAFVAQQLPTLLEWIEDAVAVPETQILGHRELIVELHVDGFAQKEVTFT